MPAIYLLATLMSSWVSAPEPAYTARLEKNAPPAAVSEALSKLLGAQALVVRRGTDVLMTLWFRTEIPVKATREQLQNGITYREIPEGVFVGVLEFPNSFTDFRKQELPAGVYTLRFAIQPDIGDHTGTSPHPEFCLLCPASEDKSPDPIDKKKLIELSSKVNDGRHPAVLLLWPNTTRGSSEKVLDKGDGVWVATLRLPVASEEGQSTLGFAVTIAGMRKE